MEEEIVSETKIKREPGYLYYVDKNGNVARRKMERSSVWKNKK